VDALPVHVEAVALGGQRQHAHVGRGTEVDVAQLRVAARVIADLAQRPLRARCTPNHGNTGILSVFPALIVQHSELKSVHPGFPMAFIF